MGSTSYKSIQFPTGKKKRNNLLSDIHTSMTTVVNKMQYITPFSFNNTTSSLHVVLTNLVNTNFAYHYFFSEPKVALAKELVYLLSCKLELIEFQPS